MTKKTLSAEDSALFRQSIGQVEQIKSDAQLLSSKEKPRPYPKQRPVNSSHNLENKEGRTELLDKLSHEDSISFITPGLQKTVLKKLRKGFFGLDASLDLHGFTSQQAQQQLSRFLDYSVENGCRCVHIIHGKGYRSSNNHPVLKNDINAWLRQYNKVQAFCSAPPKDGGTGAVYVLLKSATT